MLSAESRTMTTKTDRWWRPPARSRWRCRSRGAGWRWWWATQCALRSVNQKRKRRSSDWRRKRL
jgi:hypothetical protein